MAAGGSSIDVEDHERSRADSYPESQLARSSSSASASDPSRDRLGSKTSVASSSAGNRSSIISNEAAPGPQEGMSDVGCRREQKWKKDKLVLPIMEESDPSFSQQLPEFISSLKMHEKADFLELITYCQCEEMLMKNMNQIMSRERCRPVHSRPFIAKHHGCKFCLHVAMDKGNVSVGIQLMKGDRDKHLVWPFSMIVIVELKNQDGGKDRVKMFRCEKNRTQLKDSLMRPKNDINLPMGYPNFIAQQHLLKEGFVKNDMMLLRCYLFPKDAKINLQSECPTIIRHS